MVAQGVWLDGFSFVELRPTVPELKHTTVNATLAILIREFGGIDCDADITGDAEAVRWMENYESGLLQTLQAIAKEINEAAKPRPAALQPQAGEVLDMLKKYRVAASRMCDRWAEGDQAVKNELWKALHGLESDALDVIARAEGKP